MCILGIGVALYRHFFLGAVQLLSIGILGEYLARVYEQTRGVPRFVAVESDESVPEFAVASDSEGPRSLLARKRICQQ
jgi:hypothetical protein